MNDNVLSYAKQVDFINMNKKVFRNEIKSRHRPKAVFYLNNGDGDFDKIDIFLSHIVKIGFSFNDLSVLHLVAT